MARAGADTNCFTCYNNLAYLSNFNVTFQGKHSFHVMCKEYSNGMVKSCPKENKIVAVVQDREKVYDSEVAKLIKKTYNLKDNLNEKERDELINYLKI